MTAAAATGYLLIRMSNSSLESPSSPPAILPIGAPSRDSNNWPFAVVAGLLLLLYAAGLTRDLTRPWTGLHDWNGALFSQLARNFNRYPAAIHHGLPLVAAGATVPDPADRSLYVRHPPGIVWLVAGAFRLGGEAEWVARLVPILASLVSWGLLVRRMRRRRGGLAALLAGVLYALIPMTVYFGRMVNHEPICLMFMLLALEGWGGMTGSGANQSRRGSVAIWLTALAAAIWIDWPGALFAGLFCLYALAQRARGRIGSGPVAAACVLCTTSLGGLLGYIVYGAFEGRWSDLWAVYAARRGAPPRPLSESLIWNHVVDNATWAILILAAVGVLVEMRGALHHRARDNTRRPPGVPSGGSAMGVLTLTGLVWVIAFPRQFEIHPYWMFYLGPWLAAEGGFTLAAVYSLLQPRRPRAAIGLTGALIIATAGFCLAGQDYYFCRLPPRGDTARLNDLIDLCSTVKRETSPADTILLYRDPWRGERHGDYDARYMIPPQLMFYLDRRVAVETQPSHAIQWRGRCTTYVISLDDLASAPDRDAARAALAELPARQVGPYVVFDLRGPLKTD